MMTTGHDMDELRAIASVPIRKRPLPHEYPGAHVFDEEEEAALLRICRSKSLYRYHGMSLQREGLQFEREFASFAGVRHAVAVTSGTAALHTALGALGVGPGQEVIIPAYLWVSIASAVVNLGAIPVLADIDDSFAANPEDVERKITPRTSTILFAHMNGMPGNVPELVRLARERGLYLVEDCAQCAGGSIFGQSVGSFGDIAIFSFQLNKNMTCGEGGAVVTNHEALWRRAVAIHDVGYARIGDDQIQLEDEESYSWGRGYRIDEIRAALLRVQLRKVGGTIERMRKGKYRIRRALESVRGIHLRRVVDREGDTGGFLLTTFDSEQIARRVNQRMLWHGIVCSAPAVSNVILADYGLHIYYNIPSLVHKVPTDRSGAPWNLEGNRNSIYDYRHGCCPIADDLFSRTQMLTIPSCLSLQDEQDIIDAFHDALQFATQS